jgi:guanine deaminase
MNMHRDFLQLAVDLAIDNVKTAKGGPYGAVIVKNAEVIAASSNCVTAHLDPTAHAEVMAIRLACKKLADFQLTDCILYSSCEPCPMCLGAIYWARLAQVFFACNRDDATVAGFDDSFIYQEIALPLSQRKIPMQQLSLETAQLPFELWNSQTTKTLY